MFDVFSFFHFSGAHANKLGFGAREEVNLQPAHPRHNAGLVLNDNLGEKVTLFYNVVSYKITKPQPFT